MRCEAIERENISAASASQIVQADTMDMILFANKLFGGKHELV